MVLSPSDAAASFLPASVVLSLWLEIMVNTFFVPFCPPQYKKGGPIIAVQVENEYGSYAKDPNYMAYVKMVMVALLLVPVSTSPINHLPCSVFFFLCYF